MSGSVTSMILLLSLFFSLCTPKEVLTGDKNFDGMISDSQLNVLIKPKCSECQKVIKMLEGAHVDYNLVQTSTFV